MQRVLPQVQQLITDLRSSPIITWLQTFCLIRLPQKRLDSIRSTLWNSGLFIEIRNDGLPGTVGKMSLPEKASER